MMTAPCSCAMAIAIADLPAAVGPQMTRTLLPSEAPFELIPGDLHDRRSTVHVVRGKRSRRERDEQGPHLAGRQGVAGLDGRLARHRRGQALVACGGAGQPVARECVECFANAPERIEAGMRHGDSRYDERMTAERLDLEPQSLQQLAVRLERVGFG